MSMDDGQLFVAVKHDDSVNLYLSDVTGQYFVLSLENVYHVMKLNWLEIDFHEVNVEALFSSISYFLLIGCSSVLLLLGNNVNNNTLLFTINKNKHSSPS